MTTLPASLFWKSVKIAIFFSPNQVALKNKVMLANQVALKNEIMLANQIARKNHVMSGRFCIKNP